MIPEDALFWIASLDEAPTDDPNLLCIRHADAMVVPRGWTLDDRREDTLRLFKPQPVEADDAPVSEPRSQARRVPDPDHTPVQLVIDGTGEIERPVHDDPEVEVNVDGEASVDGAARSSVETPSTDPTPSDPPAIERGPAAPWQPDFDHADDLDGLLSVSSPLLARAFRGTDRRG